MPKADAVRTATYWVTKVTGDPPLLCARCGGNTCSNGDGIGSMKQCKFQQLAELVGLAGIAGLVGLARMAAR